MLGGSIVCDPMHPSKTPIRKRDWKKYNNALVSRAQLFLDPRVLKNWEKDLRKLNRRKKGRRYWYPDSLIRYLALIKTYYGLSYRDLESLIDFLQRYVPFLKKPDHSTIQRRVNQLQINIEDSIRHKKGLVISIDTSGLKVHNRGEWIRHKHKVRRGYLKIHFAINTKTNEIIEMDSTKEEVHDNRRFRPLVRKMLKHYSIKKIFGDAAYDDHRNFNLLDRHRIIPAIKVKQNSFKHKWHPKWDRKHRVRRKFVQMFLNSYKDWKRRLNYGRRWVSEIVFSAFKANFGEYFAAKKMENIKREIVLKVYAHNLLVNQLAKC